MFYRKVLADLKDWASSPNRKSLILRGVRQVGKTTAVRMFAREYDTYIELNLEDMQDRELFITGTDVEKLLNLIKISKGVGTTGMKVLLFIDEIQYSANAMLSLRYFYEKMPDIHVVAAGSLFEAYLTMYRLPVSVGRIEYRWMYPFDFEEFLTANQATTLLKAMAEVPYPDYAVMPLSDHFTTYSTIGGMPEAVKTWVETKDITKVRAVQANIVQTYHDDIAKYATTSQQAFTINKVMETAYYHIGKQITFEDFGQSGFKSVSVKNAFHLLVQASIFQLLYPTTAKTFPAMPNLKKKPKLFAFDLGIVNFVVGIQDKYYTEKSLHSIFKGNAMEQIVGQQLLSMQAKHHFQLQYWLRDVRSSSAELDFLLVWHNKLIPIEVKAGKTGSMKSLYIFMEESEADFAIRIYDGDTFTEQLQTPSGKYFTLLNLHLGLTTHLFDYLMKYYL